MILADPGPLSISYRSELQARSPEPPPTHTFSFTPAFGYERQLYLRPSRYCPSDHLIGFAVSEFKTGADITSGLRRSRNGSGENRLCARL